MNRRMFLGTLPLSAAGLSGAAPAPPSSARPLPAGADYFSEDRLRRLIDTSVPLDGIPFFAIAYNFPSWHPSPPQEKYFGKGWTEWETVRHATPQFAGHIQPKRPLWGYFNEADPAWAEQEIETAANFGLGAFMVDWYWHKGTQFYQEQLEQGFLRAPNRARMRFAVMWANHDWMNLYPAPEDGTPALIYPQTYSEADMDRLTDYLIEHYLREPNYWRIGGQPVFGIFAPKHILKFFGPKKLRVIFDRMRNRAARAGLKGLHIQASHSYTAGETPLKQAGFDSATHYQTLAGETAGQTSPFAQGAEHGIRLWQETASRLDVPYFPDCSIGWDNSPRYGSRAHMVTGRSPDQFERVLRAAKHFVAQRRTRPAVVFLSSWNEWTEDHYLLPDEVYGYSYLEAVRRQFGRERGSDGKG